MHLCCEVHMRRVHCDVRVAVVPPDNTCTHASGPGHLLRLRIEVDISVRHDLVLYQ